MKKPARGATRARGKAPSSVGASVHVNPDVAFREIDGHLLLLGPGDSSLFTLNGSGRFIWPLLVKGRPIPEVARALEREFGIAPADALKDVVAFVGELRARGFVVEA